MNVHVSARNYDTFDYQVSCEVLLMRDYRFNKENFFVPFYKSAFHKFPFYNTAFFQVQSMKYRIPIYDRCFYDAISILIYIIY